MEKDLAIDVIEMFSPPRVTKEADNWGLRTGEAMDLTTGWDVNLAKDRKRAWSYVREYRPFLIIGSPCCTAFSQMQSFNGWMAKQEEKYQEGVRHLKFLVQVYRHSDSRGKGLRP